MIRAQLDELGIPFLQGGEQSILLTGQYRYRSSLMGLPVFIAKNDCPTCLILARP